MSARTGDPGKTNKSSKIFMVITTIESELGGANRDIKIPLIMSPALPPVRCGRQGRAIVVNQASTRGNSGWEHSM